MTGNSEMAPNPYVGPRAFEENESQFFYGRDQEIEILTGLVIARRAALFFAQSGAGKSSLLRAGLLPELTRQHHIGRGHRARTFQKMRVLPILTVAGGIPSEVCGPIANIFVFSALLPLLPDIDCDSLVSMTLTDGLAAFFTPPTDSELEAHYSPTPTLLIFDQFEQLFTHYPTHWPEREDFFRQVSQALDAYPELHVLFTMREDFIAELTPYANLLPEQLRHRFRLEHLRQDAALLAVQQPAAQAGRPFAEGVAEALVDDLRRVQVQQLDGTTQIQLGLHVEPVQLQVVCRRLWDSLPPNTSQIGKADIEAVGDVDSALAAYYAERVAAIAAQTGVSQRAIRAWCEDQLISELGIRGQVLQEPDHSQGLDNQAIRALVDAHLVRAEARRGAIWFELAHDRLVGPVKTDNAAWRQANLSTLQRQAALWEDQGRPDGLLLRDEALEEAELWADTQPDDLTDTDREFLAACQEARAITERERRQARRIQRLAIVTTITSVVAAAAFFVAFNFFNQASTERDRAEKELRQSTARELAAAAINNLDKDPERSILLALHGASATYAVDNSVTIEVEDALHRALSTSRVRLTLVGHDDEVSSLAFSPDGTRLATASWDGTVRVWPLAYSSTVNMAPGQEPLILTGHGDQVTGVAFSPDGTRLATASLDGTAKVWLIESNSAEASNSTSSAEDRSPGQLLLTLSGHDGPVSDVAFSPDGTRLATASDDGTAKVWLLQSGSPGDTIEQTLLTLSGHKDRVVSVAFSPDGSRLATASIDRTARIWQIETSSAGATEIGQELLVLRGHTNSVSDVAFSPDGRYLATASQDDTAKLWDPISGQELLTLTGHTSWVLSVTFSADGTRLATASWDRTAKLWLLEPSSPESPDSSSPQETITAQELLTLSGHSSQINDAAFSPDGLYLATASADGTARLWKIGASEELLTLTGHTDRVSSVAFSPDGTRLLTSGWDGTAKVWQVESSSDGDAAPGQILLNLTDHIDKVRGVDFSPDGKYLATASDDRTSKVWDARSGQPLLTLDEHGVPVIGVAFSPDGTRLATASADRTARVWNVASGEQLFALAGHTEWVIGVAFSPDGTRLATASADWTAKVWSLESGSAGDAAKDQEPLTLEGHEGPVIGVAFSPDGRLLATTSNDGTAKVWLLSSSANAPSGQELLTLAGHNGPVIGVAFNPDGTRLATASEDGTARVWAIPSGQELLILSDHSGPVVDVAFSPDGRRLATTGQDKTVRLYLMNIEDLMDLARARTTRSLTPAECQKYLHMESCPPRP